MYSEFYNVELDCVRYSLVWEDSSTLYRALLITPEDHLLLITSAGCNVLNSLLKRPARVTAIDLNPVQNNMLLLKIHIIRYSDHASFRALLGMDGPMAVAQAWRQLQPLLPAAMGAYWSSFFESHPAGLLTAGKLEVYLNGFYHTLPSEMQKKLRMLISFDDVHEQYNFFLSELHHTNFKEKFIEYFDEANLSKGRDPKLFKHTGDSGGKTFYERLTSQLSRSLVKENFYFRFFFFGIENLPEAIIPPCYQEQHFDTLKSQLHKIEVVQAEAVDFLLSPEGATVTKASLSNIFEYTTKQEFEKVYRKLFNRKAYPLRLVFWNLLQDQGRSLTSDPWYEEALSVLLSTSDGCFYFRNVRVQSTSQTSVIHNYQFSHDSI